ncbi:glycosyltransferase family 4 protein [Chryseobacterium sp. A301]
MKIAYDAKRFFHNASGLGNYSRDLIRILARTPKENRYLLYGKSISARGAEILGNSKVEFRSIGNGKLARLFLMGKLAQREKADLFHGLSGELPIRWEKEPIKKVVTIHDLIFLKFPQYYSFFDRKIHYWKFKKAAEQADLIIAISNQTKTDILYYLPVDSQKVRVVYQGCHKAFKCDIPLQILDSIQEKYKLPREFLLSVGTIEERKNLLGVIEALKELKEIEIPLIVVGKPTAYQKKVQKAIKRYGLEDRVHFLTGVTMEDLACIYRLASVFVYPSFYEGFGIPVIEALYSGTPVITSNNSCLQEAGGPHSLYVDPYSSKDIAAKLRYLWSLESERKLRAEKGFEYVQKFCDETIASQMFEVYQEVLES